MIASIPSPSFDSIDIGPLSLNMYGLLIALGVVAAVWMFGRRLEQRGVGTREDASSIALWAVGAGVIGARLYHVITEWDRYDDDLGSIITSFGTGLGIPGGLLAGITVGVYVGHRKGISPGLVATCAAPAIPLAQAIGRWGNYFNQELYGKPTDLPWALEIDADHLEAGYEVGTTFHPTFLYESLWSLGLVGVLLWIDRRVPLRDGSLMAIYVMGYGVGRFWIEGLRIDDATVVGGLRWNQWVALAAVAGGAVVLVYLQRRPLPDVAPEVTATDADQDDTPVDETLPDDVWGSGVDNEQSDRLDGDDPVADVGEPVEGERSDGDELSGEDRSAGPGDEAGAGEGASSDGDLPVEEELSGEDRSAGPGDEAGAGEGASADGDPLGEEELSGGDRSLGQGVEAGAGEDVSADGDPLGEEELSGENRSAGPGVESSAGEDVSADGDLPVEDEPQGDDGGRSGDDTEADEDDRSG